MAPRRFIPLVTTLIFAFAGLCSSASGQLPTEGNGPEFTRADSLRGMLTPERTCYDVQWYHLDVRIDPQKKQISGSTTIRFNALTDSRRLQVDLYENMRVESIVLDSATTLDYEREFGAIFIDLPHQLNDGSLHDIVVKYSGTPGVAKNPPWDGGFTWTKGVAGIDWVVVTCQGAGASLWWPNKDHQSDEPDSMLISVTIPPGLEDVSNGRLRHVTRLHDGWTRFDWAVSYPINTYNVTVNIGRFVHFGDTYVNEDTLSLDYYVLPTHLEVARSQFAQVKSMLGCFEGYFGKYPFPRDGYKLVESPHLGMEHQSAIAYGNGYRQGYRGSSSSRFGILFDFIIIHESAHEWWGNSVTSKDIADMWIHESFGAHAEALYVECNYGYAAMLEYVNSKKSQVGNRRPIIGPPNVNKAGSGDMYPKGSLMLNTFRSVLDNDSLWFAVIRGIAESFKYRTVTTDDLLAYVRKTTGTDYTYFFDQYLRHAALPRLDVTLVVKGKSLTALYKWTADVADFRMPVKVRTESGKFAFVKPTTSEQTLDLGTMNPKDFRIDEDHFYVDARIRTQYQDQGGEAAGAPTTGGR
jgi:aminopeptidase N